MCVNERLTESCFTAACHFAECTTLMPCLKREVAQMKVLFIITTDDGETIYNAMRLANVAVNKGDEVSVFMLGKGVLYEKSGDERFNVIDQVNHFKGDFYV
jgi:uncharacterized protein involved in oxidation of intracellular sulfur